MYWRHLRLRISMNLKKICFTIVATLALFNASAQQEKPTIKTLLKNEFAAMQSYSAAFTQVVVDAQNVELQRAEGKLYLKQPQKLYWETFEPNELTLIADGSTLWHVDPFVEQVIAISQTDAVANHPIMLLAETDSPVWDDYSVTESNGNYKLSSVVENAEYPSITLGFDKGLLSFLDLTDRSGQINSLKFIKPTKNVELDEAIFRFSLPDGFELDDQRVD